MPGPITSTVTSIALKAIISKGFSFAKNKTLHTYQTYFGELIRLDENIGGELQRAARKAQLYATVLACKACLTELQKESREEIKWLEKLAKSLQNEFEKLSDESVLTLIGDKDSLNIFETESDDPQEFQQKLIKKLQEETFDLIRTDQSSFKFYTEDGFKLLKNKIESGWEKDTEPHLPSQNWSWFDLLCEYFQHEYNSNPKLTAEIQKHQNSEVIKKLDVLVENLPNFEKTLAKISDDTSEIRKGINELKEGLLGNYSQKSQPSAQNLLHNLPNLDVRVYGRENEKREILNALCGETDESTKRKFALLVAPSAFGKTYLLTKVLQDITDGKTIKSNYAEKVQALILIDCRLTQNILQITSEFNTLLGSQLSFDDKTDVKQWLNANLFPLTNQIGTIWIVFDNFEAWLDGNKNYEITDQKIRAFLITLFESNHNLRGIFLSQSVPEIIIKVKLNELQTVGTELYNGLPEGDALNYLRTEGKQVGLDKAEETLLKEFLKKVSYIPQALSSLIGYLSDKSDYIFGDFMSEEDFWKDFDAEEQNETDLEKGVRRTKALIARQIKAQSVDVKLLLQTLSFFAMPTPREALELVFENKASASNSISRLTSHRLASRQIDARGTIYYDLHLYFREQTLVVLPLTERIINLEYAVQLLEKGDQVSNKNYFQRGYDLFKCAGKVFSRTLDDVANIRSENQELIDFKIFLRVQLAATYNNLGNALIGLRKLNEAILEFSKSTDFLERLQNIESNVKSADNLALAYMNKGIIFAELRKLDEAIVEFDKTIKMLKPLVNSENNIKLTLVLALAYMNKGSALSDLRRSNESIVEFDNALNLLERLVNIEKRVELANHLAAAHLNKAIALSISKNLHESISELKKAIDIFERLINFENRPELASDLAVAYMNRGVALNELVESTDAIVEFDKAIKIFERLIYQEKQDELAYRLATTYVNKGIAYEAMSDMNGALVCIEIGIRWCEFCLKRGELNLFYDYVKHLRNRIRVLIKLEKWEDTARDVVTAMRHLSFLENPEVPENIQQNIIVEVREILRLLSEVSLEKREEICNGAGKNGEIIKRYIEDYEGKSSK